MTNDEIKQKRIHELRTMPYDEYLKTSEWAQKRDQALERDGHCCRACNSDKNLNVHHRTYARRGDEALDDLTTFCQSCHEHFHRKMSQAEIMGRTYEAPHVPKSKEEQAQKREDYFIGLLIQNSTLYPYIRGILSESDFIGKDASTLYQLLGYAEQPIPPALASAASRAIEVFNSNPITDSERQTKVVVQLAVNIKNTRLMQSGRELQSLIQDAANADDRVAERQLRQQMSEISKLRRMLYITTGVKAS